MIGYLLIHVQYSLFIFSYLFSLNVFPIRCPLFLLTLFPSYSLFLIGPFLFFFIINF